MRSGVRLGIDVGTVRIGVAQSDRDGILATPVETVARDEGSVARICELASERDAVEIYVGLPKNMSGTDSASTDDAVGFALILATASSIPVRLIDERLTTVSAHAALRSSGKQASRSRSVVDQVAAVMLLQHALDSERAQDVVPGTSIADYISRRPNE
jgi:putative Holliday junction resolvase